MPLSILLLNKCLFSLLGNTGVLLTDSLCDGVMALLENTTEKFFYLVLLLLSIMISKVSNPPKIMLSAAVFL